MEPFEPTLFEFVRKLYNEGVINMANIQFSWINLTEACNNNCLWCYAKNSLHDRKKMMSKKVAFECLERIHSFGTLRCILIGGEPTLHPDIIEIIRKGTKLGLIMCLVSNGRRFSDKSFTEAAIKAGLKSTDQFSFSMHALGINDSIRFTGSKKYFEEFEKGVDNLLEKGIKPRVTVTISKYNQDKIFKMVDWIKKKDLSVVVINFAGPAISQNKSDSSYMLSPNLQAKKMVPLYDYGKKIGIRIHFSFTLPFCILPEKELEKLLKERALSYGCHIRTGVALTFDVNGGLIVCNHMLDFPVCNKQQLDNTFKNREFDKLWTSKMMADIRKNACVYRVEQCSGCKYLKQCGGGCPMIWTKYNPQNIIRGFN